MNIKGFCHSAWHIVNDNVMGSLFYIQIFFASNSFIENLISVKWHCAKFAAHHLLHLMKTLHGSFTTTSHFKD